MRLVGNVNFYIPALLPQDVESNAQDFALIFLFAT